MSSRERDHLTRRDLLRLAGGTAAAVAAALWLPGIGRRRGHLQPDPAAGHPADRPLAVPDHLAARRQPAPAPGRRFWTGHITALCGLARIDGAAVRLRRGARACRPARRSPR